MTEFDANLELAKPRRKCCADVNDDLDMARGIIASLLITIACLITVGLVLWVFP